MANRKKLLPIAWTRQRWQARELSRSLRESLLADDEGWTIRDDQGVSSNTVLDYVEGGDANKLRFTLTLMPSNCVRVCRSCQTVKVRVDGAVVWMPLLQRLLLRNVVRYWVARYANGVADKVLGN